MPDAVSWIGMSPGELVALTRRRRGLSQRSLALRAGTSQAAISRIERGLESPGFPRLEELLLVMGERAVLTSAPLESGVDPATPEPVHRLTPDERLREAASWNLAATRLELAGAAARRAGHPATRRA